MGTPSINQALLWKLEPEDSCWVEDGMKKRTQWSLTPSALGPLLGGRDHAAGECLFGQPLTREASQQLFFMPRSARHLPSQPAPESGRVPGTVWLFGAAAGLNLPRGHDLLLPGALDRLGLL